MALVQCKKCGEQVSTKTNTCPECGAATPKKSSAASWFVLLFLIYVLYVVIQDSEGPSTSASSRSSQPVTWETIKARDEMTGERSSYAISPRASSTRPMSSPYQGTTARLLVLCNHDSEWAYFSFSKSPNLSNTQTRDGYHLLTTRIRWDDVIKDVILTQNWGSSSIHFRNYPYAIGLITTSNTALLELYWHGQDRVVFEFSLEGSSAALSEIRNQCSGY